MEANRPDMGLVERADIVIGLFRDLFGCRGQRFRQSAGRQRPVRGPPAPKSLHRPNVSTTQPR